MRKIFVSYSHRDRRWKDRILRHLDVIKGESGFDTWEDGQIAAGSDWLEEIKSAIDECEVALLLISADFLVSKFIQSQEVPPLLRRRMGEGVTVIPVIVHDCAWRNLSWLS